MAMDSNSLGRKEEKRTLSFLNEKKMTFITLLLVLNQECIRCFKELLGSLCCLDNSVQDKGTNSCTLFYHLVKVIL